MQNVKYYSYIQSKFFVFLCFMLNTTYITNMQKVKYYNYIQSKFFFAILCFRLNITYITTNMQKVKYYKILKRLKPVFFTHYIQKG